MQRLKRGSVWLLNFFSVCFRLSLVNMLMANPRVKHSALVRWYPAMMNITLVLAVLCNVFMLLDESKLSYNRSTHRGLRDTLTALGILLCISSVFRLMGYFMMWYPTWTGDSLVRTYQRRVRKTRKQKFQFTAHANVVHDYRDDRGHRRGHFVVAFGQSLLSKGAMIMDKWNAFVEVGAGGTIELACVMSDGWICPCSLVRH
jgi:hypothetical protein